MFLLDTNLVSELLRPRPEPSVLAWVAAQPPPWLYLSAVSLAELWQGVEALPEGRRRNQLALALQPLLEEVFAERLLPFDAAAALMLAQLVNERRRAGRPIAWGDAQIAAIAHERGLALVTRNVRDFEGCGLGLVNPWAGV